MRYISQAGLVKIFITIIYLFFAFLWPAIKSRSKKKLKKERGQYAAILTEQAWSIKYLLYGQKEDFSMRDQRRKFHHAGKMGVANQNTGFVASCSFGSFNDSFYKQSFFDHHHRRSFCLY